MYVVAAFRAITLFDGVFTFRAGIVFQILAVIIAFKGFDKPDDYVKVFYYLSFLLFFMGLFVFWDKIFDFVWLKSFSIYKGIYFQNRKQDRFGSFFLNPNFYGGFIVLILLNILSCLVLIKDKKAKAVMLAAALLTLYGLIMTRSRGPMISLVLAIVLYLILPNNKFSLSKRLKAIGGILLLLVIIMPGFYTSATARFTAEHAAAEQDEDAVSRKSMWLAALILVKNHPLFGVGLGEHKYVLAIQQETDYIDSFGETLDNPHNSYLQIASSIGLIALFLFLAINAVIILRGIKLLFKRGSGQNAFLLSGLLPGIIGFLFASIFDQGMFTMVATLYWVIMGLTYSLTRDANRHSNDNAYA